MRLHPKIQSAAGSSVETIPSSRSWAASRGNSWKLSGCPRWSQDICATINSQLEAMAFGRILSPQSRQNYKRRLKRAVTRFDLTKFSHRSENQRCEAKVKVIISDASVCTLFHSWFEPDYFRPTAVSAWATSPFWSFETLQWAKFQLTSEDAPSEFSASVSTKFGRYRFVLPFAN